MKSSNSSDELDCYTFLAYVREVDFGVRAANGWQDLYSLKVFMAITIT